MISSVLIILSIALGIITSFLGFDLNIGLKILFALLFAIAYAVAFVLLFFLILTIITLPISKKKEYTYNRKWRNIQTNYCAFFLKLTNCKIKYIGKEKLPIDTNYLIVNNHRSNVDSIVIDSLIRERDLIFVAKKSLFKIPWFGKLIRRIAYLCLDRKDPRKDLSEIKRGIQIMDEGEISICVFPEGTRNFTDEVLLPFKDGCFNLATKSKKPIVISCIKGTHEVNNGLLFKKHDITYTIIDVLYYDDYKDMNTIQLGELVRDKIYEEYIKA